mgnify:CR=1 FL=1
MTEDLATLIELDKVNSTDCCSTDLGCKILKTSIKIPRPIIVKDVPDFNYVGGVDLNNERRIDYILPSEIEWFKYRKYTNKFPYYTYMNDYIYVFNILTLKKIKVRYSPSNPIELFEMDCSFNMCDPVKINNVKTTISDDELEITKIPCCVLIEKLNERINHDAYNSILHRFSQPIIDYLKNLY